MRLLYIINTYASLFMISFVALSQKPAQIEQAEKQVWQACLQGDANAIQSACMQLATTGAYGADKLEYASNLLSSVEANAVLFTGSRGDTYPVIMLQYLKGMRNDVRIIHTDWLGDESYLRRMQSSIGLENPIYQGIRSLANKLPVYVSLAVRKEIISELASNLYCTGLAFKYSPEPLSNVKTMYNGWWAGCARNYMSSGYSLNANYLVPIAMLAGYAKRLDYTSEYVTLQKLYAEIARSVGESEELPTTK